MVWVPKSIAKIIHQRDSVSSTLILGCIFVMQYQQKNTRDLAGQEKNVLGYPGFIMENSRDFLGSYTCICTTYYLHRWANYYIRGGWIKTKGEIKFSNTRNST